MLRVRSRLLFFVLTFLLFAIPTFAADVTISGNVNFSSLDGSALDQDHAANGVFTVNSGNLTIQGTVNCNDSGPASASACSMQFAVSGDFTMTSGSALYAENRTGPGSGGNITVNAGGNVVLQGPSGVLAGAKISSGRINSTGNGTGGGNILINAGGTTSIQSGTVISAASADSQAGSITINGQNPISVAGLIASGPSSTVNALTKYVGEVLTKTAGSSGGAITITSSTHTQPALVVTGDATIVSQGTTSAGTVTLEGCDVRVNGLVASLSSFGQGARVAVRSGSSITVDSADILHAPPTSGRFGFIRAAVTDPDGTGNNGGNGNGNGNASQPSAAPRADLFAQNDITITGPDPGPLALLYSVAANGGNTAGAIRITSLAGAVNATGNAASAIGFTGGSITVASKNNATLNTAVLKATAGLLGIGTHGGAVSIRSHSGAVTWQNGVGDVRPVGAAAGIPAAQQGTITLTYCTTVSTSGTTFPTNGPAVGVFPTIAQSCSPAAPSLPVGEPALPICNRPPVAVNDAYTVAEGGTLTVAAPGVMTNDSDPDGDPITAVLVSGPAHATSFALNADGSFNYVHDGSETTSDSFTYKVSDGSAFSSVATVNITITPVNDAPVANNDSATVLEGGTINFAAPGVLANDTDPDGPTMTAILVTGPAHASSFNLNANGSWVYVHDGSETTSDSFTYKVSDGSLFSNVATVSITITPVNDPPSFTSGGDVTVNEDSGAYSAPWATNIQPGPPGETGNVNFIVSNNNNALFSVQPAISPSGVLTFTPAANANGSALVTVQAHDDGGTANGGNDTSAPQTFTIFVSAVNDAPVNTVPGAQSTAEDTPLTINGISVSDIDAGAGNVTVTLSALHGTLTLGSTAGLSVSGNGTSTVTATGTLSAINAGLAGTVYAPAANYFGGDTITVTSNDNGNTGSGGALTATNTISVTVTPVNDAPTVSAPASVSTNEDTTLAFTGGNSVSVADIDGGAGIEQVTITATNGTASLGSTTGLTVTGNGTANITATGTVADLNAALATLSYTPAADYNGAASLSVTINDQGNTGAGGALSATANVAITVNPVNDAPVVTAGGTLNYTENDPATVIDNTVTVSDIDSANLTSATVQISANFAPGQDVLAFTNTANITGTYNAVTGTLTLTGSDTVANYQAALRSVQYANTSDNPSTAPRTISWTVNDGSANSAAATSTVNVIATNDAPVITAGGTLNYTEGQPATAIDTTITVSDVDSPTLASAVAQITSGYVNGQDVLSFTDTATITGSFNASTGTLTLTGVDSVANYQTALRNVKYNNTSSNPSTAPRTVSWTVNDGSLASNTATSTINVAAVNNAPVAVNDAFSVAEGGTLTVGAPGVLANDTDVDSPTLTAVLVSGPAHASSFTLNPDGSFTYVHDGSETTVDTFTYRANDGSLNSNIATVTIAITPVNDPPVANNDSYSTNGGVTLNVPAPGVLGNDTDPDGPSIHAVLVSGPAHASSFALNADGSFTYTPAAGFTGSDSFTYKANDTLADSNVATVTITVLAVPPVANPDSYAAVGNTQLRVGTGATTTPSAQVVGSVLDNDTDADTPHSSLAVSAFDAVSANGGTVAMNPNGSFNYLPAVGFTGNDTFHYTVTDGTSNVTGLVTIVVSNRVWYVNNTAGVGDGRSVSPFNSLMQAQSASAAGDIIYVHRGDGTASGQNAGITLKNNQQLIGEGVALNVGAYALNGAGLRPSISNGGAAVTLANGNTVAGLNASSTAGAAISGTGVSGGTINQVSLNAATSAISLTSASGAFTISTVGATGTTGGLTVTGSPAITATDLTISTTGAGAKGISANGSGSLNVSGNSTISSPSGTAADITGFALGATLVSASASNDTAGIRLTNTTGSFTVTGVGTTAGSGGTIANMSSGGLIANNATNITLKNMNFTNAATSQTVTGASCGGNLVSGDNLNCVAPIYLHNVTGASFDRILVDGSVQVGINGNGVNGFSLTNSEVRNAGNESFESGLLFQNLSGTVTLTNANIHDNAAKQAYIENLSGSMTFTATGSTFSNSAIGNGAPGLFIEARNAATGSVTISSSTFANNGGGQTNGYQLQLQNTASYSTSVSGNTFTNNAAGVVLGAFNGSALTYDVLNNAFTQSALQSIIVSKAAGSTGNVSGTISGNTIGTTGVDGSACDASISCNGIDIRSSGSGTLAATIKNNDVRQVGGFGLRAIASSGSASMQLTITNNTFAEPAPSAPAVSNAINVNSGAASTDTTTVCADIKTNTISGSWDPFNTGSAIFLRNRFAGTQFRLPGFPGPGNSTAAVQTFVSVQNGATSVTATINANTFGGGAACATP